MRKTIPLIFLGLGICVAIYAFVVAKNKESILADTIEDESYIPEKLNLPLPKEDPMESARYDSIRLKLILLLDSDRVYSYEGNNLGGGSFIDYANVGKRVVEVSKKYQAKDFIVIIKPGEASSYKNTVDILDEMTINHIDRYAMIRISEKEENYLRTTAK